MKPENYTIKLTLDEPQNPELNVSNFMPSDCKGDLMLDTGCCECLRCQKQFVDLCQQAIMQEMLKEQKIPYAALDRQFENPGLVARMQTAVNKLLKSLGATRCP